VVSKACVTRKT